jgi:hypothetical protein
MIRCAAPAAVILVIDCMVQSPGPGGEADNINPQNSQFAQNVIDSGHRFGKKPNILQIKFIGKKGNTSTPWKNSIYITKLGKTIKLNDRNTVTYNKIYEVILEKQQVY